MNEITLRINQTGEIALGDAPTTAQIQSTVQQPIIQADTKITGAKGEKGDKGDDSTQITVSDTAPLSPTLNDLWIDTSS